MKLLIKSAKSVEIMASRQKVMLIQAHVNRKKNNLLLPSLFKIEKKNERRKWHNQT